MKWLILVLRGVLLGLLCAPGLAAVGKGGDAGLPLAELLKLGVLRHNHSVFQVDLLVLAIALETSGVLGIAFCNALPVLQGKAVIRVLVLLLERAVPALNDSRLGVEFVPLLFVRDALDNAVQV